MDAEVVAQESRFPGLWRIALTTTEFLVHPNLVGELQAKEFTEPKSLVMQFPALRFIGDDTVQLQRFPALLKQRSQVLQGEWTRVYSRYMHRLSPELGMYYGLGRHGIRLSENSTLSERGFIAKWAYTPWPESIDRKMQIGKRIPPDHLEKKRWGAQHDLKDVAELQERRRREIAQYGVADLRYTCGFTSRQQAITALYQVTGANTFYREEADLCLAI